MANFPITINTEYFSKLEVMPSLLHECKAKDSIYQDKDVTIACD